MSAPGVDLFLGHGVVPDCVHSPNLRGALPRPFLTSAAIAEAAFCPRVEHWAPETPEQLARDQAADQIAARRRASWENWNPGGQYFSDQEEYGALGKELCEAGLGTGLTSHWLAMCCAHYRRMLDGGAFRFLDTQQTEMQPRAPGSDKRLVCVRCGATFPQLNREACRGAEIMRERRAADRVLLGELVDLFSELGG